MKNRGLLSLFARIIDPYQTESGKGLPIGALTSQHFANFYLGGLDRLLLETCSRVKGIVRYMDDVVWWIESRQHAKDVLAQVREYVRGRLALVIKPNLLVNRSALGVPFCGYRVLPSSLRLSRRKQRRYALHRERWEKEYFHGTIDGIELQAGYSSALALTCYADAAGWRAEQLRRRPLHPLLDEV